MNFFDEGQVLLFNKPKEWTSFDVVKKIRNLTRAKRVGHAGTLDPLATGLLIVCTGPMTKKIQTIQAAEKEYTGEFFFGAETASYDLETPVEITYDITQLNEEVIQSAAKKFTGTTLQTPPLHSAVKVQGQRAYKMARRGVKHTLDQKEIFINAFEIVKVQLPVVEFRVVCSKGTYIRSLAFDLGHASGSGAYLQSLCRTRIGDYHLKDAWEIKKFAESEMVKQVKQHPKGTG